MCEYCGCQAVASIGLLTAEHDVVVGLIGRATAAVAADDLTGAARVATRIAELLGPHTEVEEQGLFPALRADFPEHVDRLVAQHRAIEAVLAGAGALLAGQTGRSGHHSETRDNDPADRTDRTDRAWGERLVSMLYELREHILAEQDGVFPAALATLGPDEWARVEAVRKRVGYPELDARARPDHDGAEPEPAR